jgi:hypothetical protein
MFDFILFEKILKFAVCVAIFIPLIRIELSPMIGHHLANRCQPPEAIQSLLEEFDAVFRRLCIEFAASKNASRTVIEDHANLFAIELADMPIEMHKAQAVIPFPSNPWLSALRLVGISLRLTMSH